MDRGAALVNNDVDERASREVDGSQRRILIVTQVPALADGLILWLRELGPGWTVIGRSPEGRGAVAAVREHRPSLVVATDDCPLEPFIDAAHSSAEGPRLLVVALRGDVAREAALVRMGVTAVVAATAHRTELLRAVDDVLRGRAVLRADAISVAAVGHDGPAGLTPRQRDVLEHLAQGRSTAQIAEALVVTPSTVKTHIRHLQERLGVDGHRALVANAQTVLAASSVGASGPMGVASTFIP